MKKGMPRFSIITATCGRTDELKDALGSALAQDYGDFEVVVADDASPDPEAVRRLVFGLGDDRVKLVRLDESHGPAGARNAAIEVAQGELLAILDDDDLMLPGRLRVAARYFDADPDLVLLASAFEAIDAEGRVQATVRAPAGDVRALLPHHNPVCHSTVTVRADVMRELGGYREPLRYSHDYDMVLRAAEHGRIEIVQEPLGRYRFHPDNVSARRSFLQGAYASVARECASRRARGRAEELEEQVARIRVPADLDPRKVRGRVHYQLGEWKFKDGRIREARPHLWEALKGEPFRPLCVGLWIATYLPVWLRRALAPVARRVVARRYASWRSH